MEAGKVEVREKDHRSVSSMCDFARCPRRHCWKHQLRLSKPSPQRDLAMLFGSAIHAAIPFTFTRELGKAAEAFNEIWKDGDEWDDPKRNSRVAKNILLDLLGVYGAASFPYEVQVPEVKAGVVKGVGPHEIEFDIDVGFESGKTLMGRIDAMWREKKGGGLWLVEYKTATQLWGTFPQMFVMAPQPETYALAMKIAGYEVVGVLVEGILVAKTRVERVSVPLILGDEDLEDCLTWWKAKDAELLELERNTMDPMDWPMERAMCAPYACFGLQGWPCEYQPLCQARGEWEGLVGMYEVTPDRPRGGEEVRADESA